MTETVTPAFPPITDRLLDWYDRRSRTLPWRGDPDPYRVWVSEIMLQQTRVETVIPYFERFTAALPDVASLAAVPEDRLLKLWEGLGYYSRARNLQKAARLIMERHGGRLPADPGELAKLPGIGEYTAGAVASIAFGIPVPAVDGNVLRVTARLTADTSDAGETAFRRSVTMRLRPLIPADRPGDFTQALMELGALVCLPGRAARCAECPLARDCRAYREGRPEAYPVRVRLPARRIEPRTAIVLCSPAGILVRRRPATGLLAGLWEFPHVGGTLDESDARAAAAGWGARPDAAVRLPERTHVFTHLEWRLTGYRFMSPAFDPPEGWRWVPPEGLRGEYAIPAAFAPWFGVLSEEDVDCGMMGIPDPDRREDP